jgi:NifB/MoaA-like Fe-S oxidoreductase
VTELGELTGAWLSVAPVVNQTFGPVTTVSGLLTGRDVVAALRGRTLGDVLLLPRAMFTGRYGAGDAPPGVTLDDLSLADLAAQLGVRVAMAGTLGEALAVLAA